MSVNGGLVGPKVRSKGVADGQQVNIPAPLVVVTAVWPTGLGVLQGLIDMALRA